MPILREAFAELPGSLWKLKPSPLPMGRSGNSVSHSPWVVRQVALETQQNALFESRCGVGT
ncbi:hypothetical protein [Leptospira kirschneri]|uniref:hypothetical protein n=1 Tax=Leptospira kirschneri TaxID=29507 RepID=UPI000291FE58|nr:hypothetical protein [Leptospira kirschneri]